MRIPAPAALASRPARTSPRAGYRPVCPLAELLPGGARWRPERGLGTARVLFAGDAFCVADEEGKFASEAEGEGRAEVLVLSTPDGQLFALSNICPHAGYPLHASCSLTDIEDGLWGRVPAVRCERHGWAFDALSGGCAGNRSVIDLYGVEVDVYLPDGGAGGTEEDGGAAEGEGAGDGAKGEAWVFVGREPVNADVPGRRSRFGGRPVWDAA
ncbi:hypothetical protein DFJ74DRAFT_765678 [Hyaloraphidium curvatum]|nr:hypothetical protein DFJ74DRAFT_765678 [Hyaloraphidium curvatum]